MNVVLLAAALGVADGVPALTALACGRHPA